MQIVVNDILVEYQKTDGTDQKILLVHGWGDSQETFDDLRKQLGNTYGSCSVDLPGFGRSQNPKEAWSLNQYAKFLGEFLEKIKYEPDLIIAHSNGAAVVIVALANGDIVSKKLILMSAAGIRDREKAKKIISKIIAKTGKTALFWLPKSKKEQIQKKFYGSIGSDLNTVPHMKETYKKTVAQDVQADATQISIPTLLIYGENDDSTPVEYGKIYNEIIKDSKLVVIPNSGHHVHQDQTKQVANLIQDFIK